MPETARSKKFKQQYLIDAIFKRGTAFSALFTLVIFVGIIYYLIKGSIPSIRAFGLHFLVSTTWDPVTQTFGGLVSIIGTLVSSIIALLIGIPISFGIAVFLTEIAPSWMRHPVRIAVELLAGIPSIIYGMWGLFVFAPFFASHGQPWLIEHLGPLPGIGKLFQGAPIGIGLLTAGIILSIMIIPFIASVMRDMFEIVPVMLKESAYALGCTTWEVVWNTVLPYAKLGVLGGIMLGLGRALGETMAVAFVIGNSHDLTMSLLKPSNTISSVLANEFTEALGKLYAPSLILLGLILFIITAAVLFVAKLMIWHVSKKTRREML